MKRKFTVYKQLGHMDCGPTCLRMIAKYYGKSISIQKLRQLTEVNRQGVSILGISKAAESIGFKTLAAKVGLDQIDESLTLPCIAHWNQNHFVVITRIKSKKFSPNKKIVTIVDPISGTLEYTLDEFKKCWATTTSGNQTAGIILIIEPGIHFSEEDDNTSKLELNTIFNKILSFKKLIVQLIVGTLVVLSIQLISPFLTQSIVDVGIQTKNLNFVYVILIAQLSLVIGRMSIEFIRSWLLLHISSRVNLSILSEFWSKLLKLPIVFFESKTTGDILQRVGDHSRVEQFLTGTSLNVLFSTLNFVLFSGILFYYNTKIFVVFAVSSLVYVLWITIFLKHRKKLENKRFSLASQNQSSLIELIHSVAEMKLNNAEVKKRWAWENIQIKEFKLHVKSLALLHYQQSGGMLINETKNILVSSLAAKSVIEGDITLGSMMALQYIIGQLNSPIEQIILFLLNYQDAKISLERLNDIHEQENEEKDFESYPEFLPECKDLDINNLNFSYPGSNNKNVLININLKIPEGKVTAIVGTSGSGKTTLLKLLLKFYDVKNESITLGGLSLQNIRPSLWRSMCGTVMQDSYIFSDTIANNISISSEQPSYEKLIKATRVANIHNYIEELPLTYNTKIGNDGVGMSLGQKQRLLIARAVYKDPSFIFLDEATNALDANNESTILENLEKFYKNKTVIVVAHRLSTVKKADQIVVLEKGEIVEIGTHAELTSRGGKYLELVQNQLELGS